MLDIIQSAKVVAALHANEIVLARETDEIRAARGKCADRNLRLVKREHSIIICQTVIGNVFLRFDGTTYTLTKGTIEQDMVLAQGTAKVVKAVLVNLFVVEN